MMGSKLVFKMGSKLNVHGGHVLNMIDNKQGRNWRGKPTATNVNGKLAYNEGRAASSGEDQKQAVAYEQREEELREDVVGPPTMPPVNLQSILMLPLVVSIPTEVEVVADMVLFILGFYLVELLKLATADNDKPGALRLHLLFKS
ncbi:hypothetical protein ACLOJK_004927 [Asimina triloba]